MKPKSEHQKKNEFLMLVNVFSEQQWGQYESLRLFQGEDKLCCYLSAWDDYFLDNIEHELDNDFLIRREEVLENLRKGIDQDIKRLEFNTEWDGYDSYSFTILASGYTDTFLDDAIRETVSYLQSKYDEEDYEYHDGDKEKINKSAFVAEKIQMLEELMINNNSPVQNTLNKFKKYVREIAQWLEDDVNSS
jgi:hypothetical protein